VHSLTDEADLAQIQSPNGVLKALYELRDQKVTRCVGMTSHTDGRVMARAIAENDLDCVQMAMNPARTNHFEELALPQAVKKDLGIVCMKVTARSSWSVAAPGARQSSRSFATRYRFLSARRSSECRSRSS
jgi:predicted aldo/keto reductase-like oxidoreductase